MKYITGKQIVFGWLAVALVLLTGCQSDGADTTPRQMATMEMQAYATSYVDAMPAASTRAGEWVPSGFTLYTGHDDIRLAFTQVKEGVSSIAKCYNPEIPGVNDKDAKGVFSFQNGKWGSSFYLPQAGSYYLYGFMSNGGNLDNLTPATEGYNAGATLNMTGLPTATSHDICVIVGVKKGVKISTDPDVYGLSAEDPIQVGQFGYTIDAGQNHVFLLCDHLYAALRCSIKVDATYHALRHIKLKKVWVKDCKNGDAAPFTSKTNVEISLLSNTTTPIQSTTFTNDDSNSVVDMEQSPLYNNADGLALSTDYSEVQGFMAPIGMTEFTLVSQYDVYDTNVTTDHPDGNLIRENQTAENKINISSLFTATTSLLRGTRYTLHLKVNPTYLYMMSEPDLDNPTMEIVP